MFPVLISNAGNGFAALISQFLVWQSEFVQQDKYVGFPGGGHPRQLPPQSRSDSSPSHCPFVQCAGCGGVIMIWQFALHVAVFGGSHCSPVSTSPFPQTGADGIGVGGGVGVAGAGAGVVLGGAGVGAGGVSAGVGVGVGIGVGVFAGAGMGIGTGTGTTAGV